MKTDYPLDYDDYFTVDYYYSTDIFISFSRKRDMKSISLRKSEISSFVLWSLSREFIIDARKKGYDLFYVEATLKNGKKASFECWFEIDDTWKPGIEELMQGDYDYE